MPDFGVADCFYARENQRVMRNSVLLCETIARPFICFIIRVIFLIPMPVVLNRELFICDMVCYLDTCIFTPVDRAYADRRFVICIFAYIVCYIVKNPSEKV